jgi:predicted DCC family thiol-disulfide oxidoreductase YuxK
MTTQPELTGLTVLYDDGCSLCTRFRDWLVEQPALVRLDLVPAGSPEARRRFPRLDHARTRDEITVVSDDGAVWTKEHAWVICLWATAAHRELAERLARPQWMPAARAAAYAAAGVRGLTRDPAGGDDYIDDRSGHCAPNCQG